MIAVERLVVLTGPGGTGKTRLAIEAARAEACRSAGAVMIDLVPAYDPAAAVASAFGIIEQPGRSWTDVLVEYLRDSRTVIVLDNCEHLIEGTATLAATLLDNCAGLRILATSREALAVPGERVVTLMPLSEHESVRLFLDRAPAGIARTEENDAAAAAICRQLDCLPLAIELAASRTATMTLVEPRVAAAHRAGRAGAGPTWCACPPAHHPCIDQVELRPAYRS